MAHFARERTTSKYTVTLKDEAGTPIAKTAVSSLKLTVFNLDDDAQTIINGRNAQEQAPGFTGDLTMGTTDGIVTYIMTPADNQIVNLAPGANQRYERHRLILDVTLINNKRLVFQDEILVENTEKITT
jgi:hypothetical protein